MTLADLTRALRTECIGYAKIPLQDKLVLPVGWSTYMAEVKKKGYGGEERMLTIQVHHIGQRLWEEGLPDRIFAARHLGNHTHATVRTSSSNLGALQDFEKGIYYLTQRRHGYSYKSPFANHIWGQVTEEEITLEFDDRPIPRLTLQFTSGYGPQGRQIKKRLGLDQRVLIMDAQEYTAIREILPGITLLAPPPTPDDPESITYGLVSEQELALLSQKHKWAAKTATGHARTFPDHEGFIAHLPEAMEIVKKGSISQEAWPCLETLESSTRKFFEVLDGLPVASPTLMLTPFEQLLMYTGNKEWSIALAEDMVSACRERDISRFASYVQHLMENVAGSQEWVEPKTFMYMQDLPHLPSDLEEITIAEMRDRGDYTSEGDELFIKRGVICWPPEEKGLVRETLHLSVDLDRCTLLPAQEVALAHAGIGIR